MWPRIREELNFKIKAVLLRVRFFVFCFIRLASVSNEILIENSIVIWRSNIYTLYARIHRRGKFSFIHQHKIQLTHSQTDITIYMCIYVLLLWLSSSNVYTVLAVYVLRYVNTGRSNPICFYGHFYDIKTFRVDN